MINAVTNIADNTPKAIAATISAYSGDMFNDFVNLLIVETLFSLLYLIK